MKIFLAIDLIGMALTAWALTQYEFVDNCSTWRKIYCTALALVVWPMTLAIIALDSID